MIQKHCFECGTALIEKELEEEGIVPYCPKCQQYRFPMYNVAVSMIVVDEETGKILLIQQYGKPSYILMAGYVNRGEAEEHAVVREVREETGLEVTRTEFLFSLPNTYLYSGFLVHTVDCFFRCTVADSSLAHAMDDAAELLWIPVKELRPEDFGLASVRKGIEKLLAQWP